jgi:uncharacterized alkaline shock family protein YloU
MTEYLIATSVLETIVRGSLTRDERLRLHSALPLVRSHPIEVAVEQDTCHVTVSLDARMGENLPSLAAEVRRTVADSLGPMTGLSVSAVDIVFGGVFPLEN